MIFISLFHCNGGENSRINARAHAKFLFHEYDKMTFNHSKYVHACLCGAKKAEKINYYLLLL